MKIYYLRPKQEEETTITYHGKTRFIVQWTDEEVNLLREFAIAGFTWAEISAMLPGRTEQACEKKFCQARESDKNLRRLKLKERKIGA